MIYDKGEVEEFVRAQFVEECDPKSSDFVPPPKNRYALKLLASRELEVHADGPNLVDVQTFTFKEPVLMPKGCFVGLYQMTFPPRIQYQSAWPRGEPYNYQVYIGLLNGAHPNEVGDVVHRCTKSLECPGLSITVKHFDDMEALEAARAQVTRDNLQMLKKRESNLEAERVSKTESPTSPLTAETKHHGNVERQQEKNADEDTDEDLFFPEGTV